MRRNETFDAQFRTGQRSPRKGLWSFAGFLGKRVRPGCKVRRPGPITLRRGQTFPPFAMRGAFWSFDGAA
jgi:hypothetical protein